MRIEELRVGNIVKCKISNDNAYYQVVVIHGMGLRVALNGVRADEYIAIENIKGIPLTPELLNQCGFVKYRYWWSNNNTTFNFEEWNDKGLGLYLHSHEHKMGQYIKHLHQLQNLYFSLTGEELSINL